MISPFLLRIPRIFSLRPGRPEDNRGNRVLWTSTRNTRRETAIDRVRRRMRHARPDLLLRLEGIR